MIFSIKIKAINETQSDYIYYPGSADLLFNVKLSRQLGEIGTLQFDIPTTNRNYNKIVPFAIVEVFRNNDWYWRGFVYNIEKNSDKTLHVTCWDDLGFLYLEEYKGVFSSGISSRQNYKNAIEAGLRKYQSNDEMQKISEQKFTIGTVENADRTTKISFDNTDNCYSLMNTIIRSNNHYMKRRYDDTNFHHIDIVNLDDTRISNQEIVFGINMLDFVESIDLSSMKNSIVYGVYIQDGDNIKRSKRVRISDSNSIALYGEHTRYVEFTNCQSESECAILARNLLNEYSTLAYVYEIRAFDMSVLGVDYESLELGDTIHVLAPQYNINDYYRLTLLEEDFINPENNIYTVSKAFIPQKTITQKVKG